jgi:hypothetical protein
MRAVLVILVLALFAATTVTVALHAAATHPSAGYVDGGKKPKT